MTSDEIKCPCCGQVTVPTGKVRVNLNENLLYFGDRALPLFPQLAELAFILARRMPAVVSHEHIIAQLWGAADIEDAANSLKVAVYALRAEIAPLGLVIVSVKRRGYYLEVAAKKSETERILNRRTGAWRQGFAIPLNLRRNTHAQA